MDESTCVPDPKDAVDMALCCAKKSDLELEKFPLSPHLMAKCQLRDKSTDKPTDGTILLEGARHKTKENKICAPLELREHIVAWCHLCLWHPGETRMAKTLGIAHWWPALRKDTEAFTRKCHDCQKNKKVRRKHGKLPPRAAEPAMPWDRVNIDLIGPLSIEATNGKFESNALTVIDSATGWFETIEIPEQTANVVAQKFDDCWSSGCPRPQHIGFNDGGENKGMFDVLMKNHGMKRKPTSKCNPQSNGIVERAHAAPNNILRTFELEERETNEDDPCSEFLSAAAFAIRATHHATLEATPAQLVFSRDMILPMSMQANWARTREKRQDEMIRNDMRENRGRVAHEHNERDKVLSRNEGTLRKPSSPRDGPHEITRVCNNGTVRSKKGAVSERQGEHQKNHAS